MPWDEGAVNRVVYKEPKPGSGRVLPYAEAVREALELALSRFDGAIVLGQGVTDPIAMFGTTLGLKEKFGGRRVFDTPVSEESMTGVCVGAAMNGLRPVLMHNRPDFMLLTFNQLVGHASKMHWLDNGQTTVPMVVWSAIGRGWGCGAQHSQAIQGLLLGVPGLKMVMPSNPFDAKGLLISAIEDNNPVLVFEHRWLMKKKGVVPEGYYKVPLGRGVCLREGSDLTIVGASHAIELAHQAAERVSAQGVDAEVIDLRTIKPLDEALILESLKKTGKLLVVDTGWAMGGVCAEIAALAAEKAFHDLKAPVRRIGLPDIPTPAGYTLEQFFYPSVESIGKVILEMAR